ncbi:hypothetical protein A5662_01295 [Mycobacteriaceae bacterium 1482268.1]|nr:hypothetical protein A5662_01295 [Mycobacteriaceae bacterium 1482268.1]
MRRKRWLTAAVVTGALVSCQLGREAGADPVSFTLGQQFTLSGGQEAVSGENLRVRFTDVLEDSRCPLRVECFWTGQARVAVVVQSPENPSTTVEFNTNPASGQNKQTVRADGYTISLKTLEPYPQTPDDPISFEDYRAELLVQR